MNSIPIIDFSGMLSDDLAKRKAVALEVDKCAREVGFMYLKNFGIASERIAGLQDTAKRFFAQSLKDKEVYQYDQDTNFGYATLGKEALDPLKPKDLKETFTMRNVEQFKKHSELWPSELFSETCYQFYYDCCRTAELLMQAFGIALDLPSDFFTTKHTGSTQTLRLLHYPPSESSSEGQLGAGAHTDYGTTTFVFQDNAGGLEVQNDSGKWIPAPPIEGTIVVNTGDLLARWTNDQYRSTPHRVQVRPAAATAGRLSIAFFNDPDPEVIIETLESCIDETSPNRYPKPVTAHDHILERIAASNM